MTGMRQPTSSRMNRRLASPQVPVPEPGRYRVALDSDAWDFGGPGRVGHDVDHFTQVRAGCCAVTLLVCVLRGTSPR